MKKILLVLAILFLSSCDIKVKKCTYDVYQKGVKLQTDHVAYMIHQKNICKDFSKDGNFFKLKEVKYVNYNEVMK